MAPTEHHGRTFVLLLFRIWSFSLIALDTGHSQTSLINQFIFSPLGKIMVKKYSISEKARITENANLILREAVISFNNQKEVWNDIDKKVFYILGFTSVFITFILVNDLLSIFSQDLPVIFKFSLIAGLIFIFYASYILLKIITPTEFKISASVKDLRQTMEKNKLFNAKFKLINAYESMNNDNNKKINLRAKKLQRCIRLLLVGLLFILFSKSQALINFLLSLR